ncbi:MAG TPA: hypothetical protein DCE56_07300, partial [Cyanobacteria bacterium UBA8553]|nr:hypothetical protein [Cyanobacteria bacterium UBA8553]
MSDDQQKQPESASSESQTPPQSASAGQTGKRLEKMSRTTQPSGNLAQRLVKTQGVKILRGTIGVLEGFVEKLEAEPVTDLSPNATPPITTVSVPVSDTTTATPEPVSTSSVVEPVASTPASDTPRVKSKLTAEELASGSIPQPTKPKLIDRLLPSFNRVQAFWDATLQKVRSLLPPAWNEKLSDWGLTSAIAGIVVVLLLTTVALLPKTPTQQAKALPKPIDAPPVLKAPDKPQPVEALPQPAPELTPEQNLIASIQNQVAEITDQYGNGLIKAIQANFPGSRLVVKVTDGWYDLKEPQQNKLADDILSRSKELDFRKLEITDLEGTLLARSPV